MQSKVLAGVSGLAGLAVLGFIANQVGPNSRVRRAVVEVEDDDTQFFSNDISEGDMDDGSIAALAQKYGMDSEDDVQNKALPKRFRETQIPQLHSQMNQEWERRVGRLQDFLDLSGIVTGKRDPSEFGSEYGDEGQRTYNLDKTTDKISGIIDELNCNIPRARTTYTVGMTNFWFLLPQSIPLWADSAEGHVADYKNFFQFVRDFSASWEWGQNIKFTVGRWGRIKNLFFPPNPIKVAAQARLKRVLDFVGRRYQKPSMTVAQPAFSYTIQRLIAEIPRKGATNTRTAGDNCYVVMFFTDIPTDMNNFYSSDGNVKVLEEMCTVVPIVVGDYADSGTTEENAHRMIAALFPDHQRFIADDADYAGWFYARNIADLVDPRFVQHFQNYICMHQARVLCRLRKAGWEAPPSVDPTPMDYMDEYADVSEDDAYSVYEPEDAGEAEDEYDYAMREATATPTAEEEESEPEIDRCCGSDFFTATAYESEIKTCCDDGRTLPFSPGSDADPCLGIGNDYGDYGDYGDYYK